MKNEKTEMAGSMLIDFIKMNISILMILFLLAVIMYVNRKVKIPASGLFLATIYMALLIVVLDYLESGVAGNTDYNFNFSLTQKIHIRTVCSVLLYSLRPLIILVELLIICPNRKIAFLTIIPSIINAIVYFPTLFGVNIAFFIDGQNNWHGIDPLCRTVYAVQLLYIVLLYVFSVLHFQKNNLEESLIILAITVISIVVAVLEFYNVLPRFTTTATALGMLAYYTYLCTVYQQKMRETIAEKELNLVRSELKILRNQIQPHFIYNSLSTIRSLAKRDSAKAVECIDEFSDYLKSHISAIQSDELIPFESELENIKAYLSMVQAGHSGKIEVVYELGISNFMIPPLALEPIVENAVNHGISIYGGTIVITTYKENNNIIIRVKDDGNIVKDPEGYRPIHNGIGLENVEKRLKLQCGGQIRTDFSDKGATIDIIIPVRRGEAE